MLVTGLQFYQSINQSIQGDRWVDRQSADQWSCGV